MLFNLMSQVAVSNDNNYELQDSKSELSVKSAGKLIPQMKRIAQINIDFDITICDIKTPEINR